MNATDFCSKVRRVILYIIEWLLWDRFKSVYGVLVPCNRENKIKYKVRNDFYKILSCPKNKLKLKQKLDGLGPVDNRPSKD